MTIDVAAGLNQNRHFSRKQSNRPLRRVAERFARHLDRVDVGLQQTIKTSSVRGGMTGGASGIFPYSRRKPICMCRPFGCIVRAAKPVLYGRTCRTQAALQQAFPLPCRRTSPRFDSRPARMQQAPASTIQRIHHEAVPAECERIYEQVCKEAKETSDLVLGVDDFASKKGHTDNTGIHNLKGETMLDLLPGRKLDDLRAYARQHPDFLIIISAVLIIPMSLYLAG